MESAMSLSIAVKRQTSKIYNKNLNVRCGEIGLVILTGMEQLGIADQDNVELVLILVIICTTV
jgi:hypothetical protein